MHKSIELELFIIFCFYFYFKIIFSKFYLFINNQIFGFFLQNQPFVLDDNRFGMNFDISKIKKYQLWPKHIKHKNMIKKMG